jgi:SAM-dependent methyltransferase
MIDTKNYWEERLSTTFNLGSVGFQNVGEHYNYWLYKMRLKIIKKIIKEYFPKSMHSKILDVGSGTGFYLEIYLKNGYKNITGIDFTNVSVNKLLGLFPQLIIIQKDICDNIKTEELQNFDIITCFDVLFHIVDSGKYSNAFKNFYSYLNKDGYLIFSENFCPIHKDRVHIVDRTKIEIETALVSAGFEIISKYSLFFLLNPPRNSENKILWKISNTRVSLLSFLNSKGYSRMCYFIGFFLYVIDSMLHKSFLKSTGTEIVIAKKRKI